MNRRHIALLVLINAMVSLVIALAVVWVYEIRRPESDELAALYAARPNAVLAATPAPANPVAILPTRAQNAGEAVAIEAAVTAESAPVEQEVYVVKGGDSLVAIAVRYGVTVDELVEANSLANPDYVFSGQRLLIPVSGGNGSGPTPTVVIREGVEISGIAGAGDLATESAQIVNDSDQAFSMEGWQLTKTDGPVYTFGNVPLFPGGSVRVNTRAGEDSSIELYWGQSEAQWNSGDVAQLLNERGSIVHSYIVP